MNFIELNASMVSLNDFLCDKLQHDEKCTTQELVGKKRTAKLEDKRGTGINTPSNSLSGLGHTAHQRLYKVYLHVIIVQQK